MSTAAPLTLDRIRDWLTAQSVPFRELHHEPTRTSEDSARVRGEPLHHGGKALLLKGDAEFALFVLPADRQLDSNAIRQRFGWRKLRFATPEELMERTGLVPGSVPPFGPPILPFDLYLDEEIPQNERIAFNAGALTDSIILAVADYLRVAQPRGVFRFGGA
jgi:prolyl-tRNA editing enzyme YbaK/EbsC (Cys-tRNA(Pro) deacylase)